MRLHVLHRVFEFADARHVKQLEDRSVVFTDAVSVIGHGQDA